MWCEVLDHQVVPGHGVEAHAIDAETGRVRGTAERVGHGGCSFPGDPGAEGHHTTEARRVGRETRGLVLHPVGDQRRELELVAGGVEEMIGA